MTTRAVCEAAGVQAPTIYRFFGDKSGLLDAVTGLLFESYVDRSVAVARRDPVDDLRGGWDLHVGFGLENPAAYAAVYGAPRTGRESSADRRVTELLAARIRRIAEAGRLTVPERRAVRLVHSAARGTTLELLGIPWHERDLELADLAREAAITAITDGGELPPRHAAPEVGAALALREGLDGLTALTEAERTLLATWLDRVTDTG